MNAGVGALGDDAEEAARAPSPPPLSAVALSPGAPSPPLLSAAAPSPSAPSPPLRSAVVPAWGAPSSPLRSAMPASGAPSPPLPSAAAPAPGAPLASDVSGRGAGGALRDLCDKVVERLVAGGRLEPSAFDSAFRDMLAIHFARLPESYHLYLNDVNAEDVITHMKLLEEAMDPDRRPAIHVQFLGAEKPIADTRTNRDDVRDTISTRPGLTCSNIHEIIFCSVHNDRLLSQLSAMLSDIGLNVKHVDVFLTSDGFSLFAFTVEGWPTKNIIGLVEALKTSISTNERSWSIFCSSSYVTPPKLPAYFSSNSSTYATTLQPIRSARSYRSQTRTNDRLRRLHIIKMRKRAEKVKQQKMMESFRSILSYSVSFLFPTMLAIFTSGFDFHHFEKPFLIMVLSMGGFLVLLNMVISHGVEAGPGRTAVVSFLTLLTVIYVFGMSEYFLYKFFPTGDYQVTALHCIGVHFIFGVLVLGWLWAYSFKTST